MHDKNIKLNVRKQLKKQYPNWKRLGKKLKKEIACKVLGRSQVTAVRLRKLCKQNKA